jgi:hypothetical protein
VKIRSLIAAIALLAAVQLMGQQLGQPQAPAKGSTLHTIHAQGRGCVRPGKEEGCFVVHDIKAHRYYDLTFDSTNARPDLYTAIWFEGIGYHHDAHCSQGQPIHVSHWKPMPGKCSQADTSKSKTK